MDDRLDIGEEEDEDDDYDDVEESLSSLYVHDSYDSDFDGGGGFSTGGGLRIGVDYGDNNNDGDNIPLINRTRGIGTTAYASFAMKFSHDEGVFLVIQ